MYFILGILCYLHYLKNAFIQNKCVFNKYKSYIIFLYYILFYCINIILFYLKNFLIFICFIYFLFYFILLILYYICCYIIYIIYIIFVETGP